MKYKIQDGQDIFDITIQSFGEISATFTALELFSQTRKLNVFDEMIERPYPVMESGELFGVVKTEQIIDPIVVSRFKNTNFVVVNDGSTNDEPLLIGIGEMIIGSTNIIG